MTFPIPSDDDLREAADRLDRAHSYIVAMFHYGRDRERHWDFVIPDLQDAADFLGFDIVPKKPAQTQPIATADAVWTDADWRAK